jgi:hypothetical protein
MQPNGLGSMADARTRIGYGRHLARWTFQSQVWAIPLTSRSTTASRPVVVSGKSSNHFWISGASDKNSMICETRARVTRLSRASSAWSVTTPSRISWSKRIARAINRATRQLSVEPFLNRLAIGFAHGRCRALPRVASKVVARRLAVRRLERRGVRCPKSCFSRVFCDPTR